MPRPGALVVKKGSKIFGRSARRIPSPWSTTSAMTLRASSPHRVRNTSGRDRLSYPFFLDPGWESVVRRLALADEPPPDDAHRRWDRADVHAWEGPYGDYLLAKVAKVFPDLGATTSE